MPELNLPYGYLFAWLLMLAIGIGLVVFVWRKGWLASTENGNGYAIHHNGNSHKST